MAEMIIMLAVLAVGYGLLITAVRRDAGKNKSSTSQVKREK